MNDRSAWVRRATRAAKVVGAAAAALALSACYAQARGGGTITYSEPVIEAEVVPYEVETYPTYAYGGVTWYLVDGRWYSRRGDAWVIYRDEPTELRRYRVGYYSSHPVRRPPRYVEYRRERRYRRY